MPGHCCLSGDTDTRVLRPTLTSNAMEFRHCAGLQTLASAMQCSADRNKNGGHDEIPGNARSRGRHARVSGNHQRGVPMPAGGEGSEGALDGEDSHRREGDSTVENPGRRAWSGHPGAPRSGCAGPTDQGPSRAADGTGPRGQDVQAPRNIGKGRAAALTNARRLVAEAETACKDADSQRALANAHAAIELLKYVP